MNNLTFDWVVLNSLLHSLNRHILSEYILVHLGYIFGLVLNSIVISDHTFTRNLDDLSHFFILDVGSLIWYVSIHHVKNSYSIRLSPLIGGAATG
jgi:hypothetical protein